LIFSWYIQSLYTVGSCYSTNPRQYYVYQGDIVPGAEDLRTPTCMSDSLDLKRAVRGQIAGFFVPKFILDLPAAGGKRLTRGVESYDRHIGLSQLTAPGLKGEPTTVQYWDPLWSLSPEGKADILAHFGKR
jgi:lysine 2,3-aminomutase